MRVDFFIPDGRLSLCSLHPLRFCWVVQGQRQIMGPREKPKAPEKEKKGEGRAEIHHQATALFLSTVSLLACRIMPASVIVLCGFVSPPPGSVLVAVALRIVRVCVLLSLARSPARRRLAVLYKSQSIELTTYMLYTWLCHPLPAARPRHSHRCRRPFFTFHTSRHGRGGVLGVKGQEKGARSRSFVDPNSQKNFNKRPSHHCYW